MVIYKKIALLFFSLCLTLGFNSYASDDIYKHCRNLKEGQEYDGTSINECFFANQSLITVYQTFIRNDHDLIKHLEIMKDKVYNIQNKEDFSTMHISYKWQKPTYLTIVQDMYGGNEVRIYTFDERVKGTKLTIRVETQY